ncbi:hypothetical protein HYW20_04570 [Candidatus Woesearchaeota archaeon]|nr:hypothetical protein [Candidatus Woesearchaeota archaeon]
MKLICLLLAFIKSILQSFLIKYFRSTAILSAMLKLGDVIRLMAVTKDGVKEL